MDDSINRLATGQRLVNFNLPDLRNVQISLSSYRRRSNMVVIFSGEPVTQAFNNLLDEISARYDEVEALEAEVLAVVPVPQLEALGLRRGSDDPFPVLVDADGAVHRRSGAVSTNGEPAFTIAILDRYGEVYGLYGVDENSPPPGLQGIIEWLEYIELQCDE